MAIFTQAVRPKDDSGSFLNLSSVLYLFVSVFESGQKLINIQQGREENGATQTHCVVCKCNVYG